jgi:hypothetical protein
MVAPTVLADVLSIHKGRHQYRYTGCFSQTDDGQALKNSISVSSQGGKALDVPTCSKICDNVFDHDIPFQYAGLEYDGQATDCWCAEELAPDSAKLDDGDCDAKCDGDASFACGGLGKITLYNLTESAAEDKQNKKNSEEDDKKHEKESAGSEVAFPFGIMTLVGLAALCV